MIDALALTQDLIACPSVTPEDAGAQDLLITHLSELGFDIHRYPKGAVSNFFAVLGTRGPLFCFAGHTDVVPAGDLQAWHTPPFEPTVQDGVLFGRGAADMKASLAAMLSAQHTFLQQHQPNFRLGWLITSNEEGAGLDGTPHLMNQLKAQGIQVDYCLVGEPSSHRQLGDTIRHGRRGSLSARLIVNGVQGHVAYPDLARNPIHETGAIIAALSQISWDEGTDDFPPTSFQVSNLNAGTGATNVIPGTCTLDFNFRFNPGSPADMLKARVIKIIAAHCTDFDIVWDCSGEPFITPTSSSFVSLVQKSITQVMGYQPTPSTGGGTSDGRFIAPTGAHVVELGPINKTIHQINECVGVEEVGQLTQIYLKILENFNESES